MVDPASQAFDELVRAHAYARLQTLTAEERERWSARGAELARRLGVESPAPRDGTSALVWRITLDSLGELRPALRDGPAWLKHRYAEEERRRLEAYVETFVDVLLATARGSSG